MSISTPPAHKDFPDPPTSPPEDILPAYETLERGRRLHRIYAPASFLLPRPHTVGPTTFRHFGPTDRFDHHAVSSSTPGPDLRHGIYYAGVDLWDCAIEVFWRTRIIRLANNRYTEVMVNRDLTLLDLRDEGAMRIGASAALSKGGPRERTQAWARYIYRHTSTFTRDGQPIDGLLYSNSHNEGLAVALFERASRNLRRHSDRALRSGTIRESLECLAIKVPSLSVEP